MIEFYHEIKWVHVAAVLLSGSVFMLRAVATNLGAAWAMAAPLRYLTYAVDTALLTAALMLTAIVRQYPFVDAWLTVKVLLLVLYIGLGTFALKRGRTRPVRTACAVAAIVTFALIISVARAHHPLGWFAHLIR
jgi:uncharacterized membrane protein SirB2